MNRGNAFMLSANMALGGGGLKYANYDTHQIKDSLQLLKSKKNQI
jgi:hypothetical protein